MLAWVAAGGFLAANVYAATTIFKAAEVQLAPEPVHPVQVAYTEPVPAPEREPELVTRNTLILSDVQHTLDPDVRARFADKVQPLLTRTGGGPGLSTPEPKFAELTQPALFGAHDGHVEHTAANSAHLHHAGATHDDAEPVEKQALSPCVADLREFAARTRIYFNSASAKVDARGMIAARMVADMARNCPEAQITVLGFTDPKGDELVNLALSWQRARNVADLVKNLGGPDQFTALSHMEDHPEHCDHYDVVDRRVEFEITQVPTTLARSN